MEKQIFTQKDLEEKCLGRIGKDALLYFGCAALFLVLGTVCLRLIPEIVYLYGGFFTAALFFAVLGGIALTAKERVRSGKYTVACGTVKKKHEKGICDAGANYLVFTFGEAPVKEITAADLTPQEFAAASGGDPYYVFIPDSRLSPKPLCAIPAEEYTLAPALQEKRVC